MSYYKVRSVAFKRSIKKIFQKPDGIILYAKEGNHHKTTWAEVIGYGEVY